MHGVFLIDPDYFFDLQHTSKIKNSSVHPFKSSHNFGQVNRYSNDV